MDDAIATMTPEQAGARLAEMSDASKPALAPTQDARARLDVLSRDSSFSRSLFAGDMAARRQFDELVAAAAGGDTVTDTLAGIDEPQPLFETTRDGQLPSRVVKQVIADMRGAGISDGAITQAMRGDPVTAAEHAATKSLQAMRHGDADWVKRLISGDWSAHREHQLMSIILSSPIAEMK